ncbi:cellulose synthase/poly-beta-1,6-N-acetylglucosamine synthase-like glycosyltransferase [Actinopolyspora biskrensis]|uniref:Cellulose synthase/poly-beta-1,6-N-acetylglucosamine synthase-like glycosyltransferase n=1 Tax=Actinopolyspora biskrensis TaxID=1470178 RepID=A0A852YXJ6_9ACTN|nr:cellulose synthase/poly-beta-1,6-N-acetylglucosamine synthase-like glycosyltransferase [Actinopolyspora biskrensis]
MVPWWLMAVLVFGANFMFWGGIGLLRATVACGGWLRSRVSWRSWLLRALADLRDVWSALPERRRNRRHDDPPCGSIGVDRVAVLMPAHNEELVISESLESVTALVPRSNIHVVSDGSTDRTVELAERAGVNVISTHANVGKAGALREAVERFGLVERYPIVLLLDADTRLDGNYFRAALPLFDNPEVAAVAGFVRSDWDRSGLSVLGRLLVCHRQRIYALGQYLLKFGQTWLRCNATHIVPGFASMYRTAVLPYIDMDPPGLVIEDFNMTFEVYQKGLGKVGFTPKAVAITQDPDNLGDYVRQTRRWALGLWQTVRRHRPRVNLFSCMLFLLLVELVTSSLMMVLFPVVLLVLFLPRLFPVVTGVPVLGPLYETVTGHVSPLGLVLGVVVVDLSLSLLVAVVMRKPRFLLFGGFFLVLRVLDCSLSLYTLPMAWLTRSTGRWRSPGRRAPVRRGAAAAGPDPTAGG